MAKTNILAYNVSYNAGQLKDMREAAGLSLNEMSEICHWSAEKLASIEAGSYIFASSSARNEICNKYMGLAKPAEHKLSFMENLKALAKARSLKLQEICRKVGVCNSYLTTAAMKANKSGNPVRVCQAMYDALDNAFGSKWRDGYAVEVATVSPRRSKKTTKAEQAQTQTPTPTATKAPDYAPGWELACNVYQLADGQHCQLAEIFCEEYKKLFKEEFHCMNVFKKSSDIKALAALVERVKAYATIKVGDVVKVDNETGGITSIYGDKAKVLILRTMETVDARVDQVTPTGKTLAAAIG